MSRLINTGEREYEENGGWTVIGSIDSRNSDLLDLPTDATFGEVVEWFKQSTTSSGADRVDDNANNPSDQQTETHRPTGGEEPNEVEPKTGPQGNFLLATQGTKSKKSEIDTYTDKIIKTIPVEIVTAWLFIHELLQVAGVSPGTPVDEGGVIPRIYFLLIAAMVVLTTLHLIRSTRDVADPIPERVLAEVEHFLTGQMSAVRWRQIILGTAAFVAWVFYLGGPFTTMDFFDGWYNQTVASILLVVLTAAIPLFIPEDVPRGRLGITDVESDPDDEVGITLQNVGSGILDLGGWSVWINDNQVHVFDRKTRLETDETLTIKPEGAPGDPEKENTPDNSVSTKSPVYAEEPFDWKTGTNKITVKHDHGWTVVKEKVEKRTRANQDPSHLDADSKPR